MFARSVLLALIVFFSNQQWTSPQELDWQPYYCDTYEGIREIQSLDIQRLLYSYLNDYVYVILPNKIIRFRLPHITRRASVAKDHQLVTSQLEYLIHEEPRPAKDRKVLAFSWRITTDGDPSRRLQREGVYETYLEGPMLNSTHRKMSKYARKLSFDQVPGERGKLDVSVDEMVDFPADREFKKDCHLNVVNYYENFNVSKINIGNKYCNEMIGMKSFLNVLRSFDPEMPVHMTRLFFTANNGFVISEITIDYLGYVAEKLNFTLDTVVLDEIPLLELFSCPFPPKKIEQQVKGIYYTSKTYYIFFARFYLMIDKDLFETGDLTKKQFKARNLRFEDPNTRFEIIRTQWVKMFGAQVSYLVPYRGFVSEIKLDEKNRIADLAQIQKPMAIDDCPQSTLLINNHLYCFDGKLYNYMLQGDEIHDVSRLPKEKTYMHIKDIFNTVRTIVQNGQEENRTTFLWEAGERLLWTSSHEPGWVVLWTNVNMWLFQLKYFTIDPQTKKLTYDASHEQNFNATRSTMLEDLQSIIITPGAEKPVTTPKPKPTEPTTERTTEIETEPTTRRTGPTTRPTLPTVYPTRVTTRRTTRLTQPTKEETEETEEETETSTTKGKRKSSNTVLIWVIVLVALVIIGLLIALAFIYRKKGDSVAKQTSLEAPAGAQKTGSQGSLGKEAGKEAKSSSKEQLKKSASKTGKSPSKRSIRATSKERAKSKTGSQTSLQSKSPAGKSVPAFKSTGFQVPGKSEKSLSKSQTSLQSGKPLSKSQTSLKGNKSITKMAGKSPKK